MMRRNHTEKKKKKKRRKKKKGQLRRDLSLACLNVTKVGRNCRELFA